MTGEATPIGSVVNDASGGSDTAPSDAGMSADTTDAASCIARAADAAPSGSEDPDFASGVKASINVLSNGMALDAQGRIYVVGYSSNACPGGVSTGQDLILARFTRAGEVDTSFNVTGKVCVDFNQDDDTGMAVGIDSNNQPVVAGAVDEYASDGYAAGIIRFTETGALDNTLNGTGRLELKGPSDGGIVLDRFPFAIAFDGSKILLAGSNISNTLGFISEVNHDGTPHLRSARVESSPTRR